MERMCHEDDEYLQILHEISEPHYAHSDVLVGIGKNQSKCKIFLCTINYLLFPQHHEMIPSLCIL